MSYCSKSYATTGMKSDETDSFYEEFEQVSNHFPIYHMKILIKILMQNWGERTFLN